MQSRFRKLSCTAVGGVDAVELDNAAARLSESYANVMQSRFRKLSCTAVGGADAERFSIGAEEVNYEGPLQLRLQVFFSSSCATTFDRARFAGSVWLEPRTLKS